MSFEQALDDNRIPRRVGDVRLRYEDQLLIGEARGGGSPWSSVLLLAALGSALASAAALLFPDGPVGFAGAVTLAALAAACLAGATYLERGRRPRRFVLNFDAETLRLEGPPSSRGAPSTVTVSFDAVCDVGVVPGPRGGFWLEARYELGPGTRAAVLVDRAGPADVESLRRLWKLLRAAFGLDNPPP